MKWTVSLLTFFMIVSCGQRQKPLDRIFEEKRFEDIPFQINANELSRLKGWGIFTYRNGVVLRHYSSAKSWNQFIVVQADTGFRYKINSDPKWYGVNNINKVNAGDTGNEIVNMRDNAVLYYRLIVDEINWHPSEHLLFFKNDRNYLICQFDSIIYIDSLIPESKHKMIVRHWYSPS